MDDLLSSAVTRRPRRPRGSAIIRHQPELMREEQAKADAIIEYARKVKDWPLLVQAVTEKVEQQAEFVQWWKANVRRKGGDRWLDNADRGYQVADAERLGGIAQQQVSRWKKRIENVGRYIERLIAAEMRAAELQTAANHRAEGTGDNEWFTPPDYVEAARLVLEDIDLDPATHPQAQQQIKAANFFTKANDGLKQDWHGRVWLNPPYARGEIAAFVEKLVDEITVGHVTSAILLTHSYTDTEWFHRAASIVQAICFTRGRVKFVDDTGIICAPTQGQAFFYYGPDVDVFEATFSSFGFVVTPWRPGP